MTPSLHPAHAMHRPTEDSPTEAPPTKDPPTEDPFVSSRPVIIGAGPIGLATAVHLLARGHRPLILEAGSEVGAAIRTWGHVRMFSPWSHLVDAVARSALEARGWASPDPHALPTGDELIDRYLKPLSELPEVSQGLRLGHRVVGVSREGRDRARGGAREGLPFQLLVEGDQGQRWYLRASVVLDCSGNWGQPNPLGGSGLPAIGEDGMSDRITYGIPMVRGEGASTWEGQRVMVVGSGHSAMNALLEVVELARQTNGPRPLWVTRGAGPFQGERDEADALSHRAALEARVRELVGSGEVEQVTGFATDRVEAVSEGVMVQEGSGQGGSRRLGPVDRIVVATGSRPDLSILRELRLDLDPRLECPRALAPLIDPDVHTCETARAHGAAELAHPEPDVFVLGMKSYGRAPGFLLATGYEQVRSVAAALSGDLEGARSREISAAIQGACSGGVVPAGHSVTSLPPSVGHSESSPASGGCCS